MSQNTYKLLTQEGPVAYMKALETIGWFDFDSERRDILKKKLAEVRETDKLLYALADLSIDMEGFEDPNAYVSLLNELLPVAKVKANVTTTSGKKKTLVSIEVRAGEVLHSYALNLNKLNGWMNQDFIDKFVNETILQSSESKFLALPPDDQSVHFVFIPEKLYDKAVNAGVIPGDMGYFMA